MTILPYLKLCLGETTIYQSIIKICIACWLNFESCPRLSDNEILKYELKYYKL